MSSLNVNHHMNKLIIIVLIILSTLVVSVLLWLSPKNSSINDSVGADIPSPVIEKPKAIISKLHSTSRLETLSAESLIQGLEILPDGHLKITEKARYRLDVFLGDSKALSDAKMTSTKDQIHQNMKEPAATEAIALLEHYAAYKKALAAMELSTPQIEQQNEGHLLAGVKMQRLSVLRNQYLTPQITQAFYAEEDTKAQFELARQQILSMDSLSDEQQQQQIAELQTQLKKSADTRYL